ncbi:hypothetical protein D9M68_995240 [compost metagenome]
MCLCLVQQQAIHLLALQQAQAGFEGLGDEVRVEVGRRGAVGHALEHGFAQPGDVMGQRLDDGPRRLHEAR